MLSKKLGLSSGAELEADSILGGCCIDDVVDLPGMSLSTFAACRTRVKLINVPLGLTSYSLKECSRGFLPDHLNH